MKLTVATRAGGRLARLGAERRGKAIPSPYNGSLENQLTEYHAAELQRVAYRLALAGKPGWQRQGWETYADTGIFG